MKYPDDFVNKIICGDCNNVMSYIPSNSIDMIITDPPYSKEYDYLYDILFKHAARILKSRGNLISPLSVTFCFGRWKKTSPILVGIVDETNKNK